VLVLLPPSETKRDGGDGPPLDLAALPFPELTQIRRDLADELVKLAADPAVAREALGLSPRQDAEIARNAALWTSPTMPALYRYTGVLYDALDVASLRGAALARARHRLVVGSALFGLVRFADPIPAYRFSAGSALPGAPTTATRWKPVLEPLLADVVATGELVVDLRSGSYAALARVPGAVSVTVLAEHPDGRRTVVSHFNKAHKGLLARVLVSSRAEPGDAAGVAAVARRAGMRVERRGAALRVVVPA
jgi:cytoplasmic iron level regulating protein YaaA (DUF328/UPF0246 family)